jgi:hypothetical protein
MLTSQENSTTYVNGVHTVSQDDNKSQTGGDGIFVRVDFDVEEEAQVATRHDAGVKYAPY